MTSNCSLYPLKPLLPEFDPAYTDGPPPPVHRASHAGEVDPSWPFGQLPVRLSRFRTISLETLEEEVERVATREGR
jgi:hypothetical protein